MPRIEVGQGDCLSSLAARSGVPWQVIWDHPDNADLKSRRQDPNALLPGDVVMVPDLRPKQESGGTETRHRFRRKGASPLLRVRMLREGQPRANEKFRVVIDGAWQEGTTGPDGMVEVKVPPAAQGGAIHIGPPDQEEIYHFRLGHLDPLDTESGVRQRLTCLGFAVGEDPAAAIRAFQAAEGLAESGQADGATQARLKERFGR